MNEDIFSIKLVQEVEKYPVLYNYKLNDYNNREVVYLAWESIGRKMNDTGEKVFWPY